MLAACGSFFSFAADRHPKPVDFIRALKKITDVMVNDVTSPVAASRYYAYCTIAAWEVEARFHPGSKTFAGVLNDMPPIRVDLTMVKGADEAYTVYYTLFRMGEKLLPSGYVLTKELDSLDRKCSQEGLSAVTMEKSRVVGDIVVKEIMQYVRADNFSKLSGLPRYTPKAGAAYWQPTAPAFMHAIEPHWATLRTFTLDSAAQFRPSAPAAYDTAQSSRFYMLMKEVYTSSKGNIPEQNDIANFWDCNPFALQQIGHVEFGLKKISPGGHWLGITGITSLKQKLNFSQTIFVHAAVSIALADGFISCWDEKFNSNRVRPETAIRNLIDQRWQPLLQTPPFPEYPSGHSVISAAAAEVLTTFVGDNISFADDTEVEFGVGIRTFPSFRAASHEAGISRLYGGIHFRDAIEDGQSQGASVGKLIVKRLLTAGFAPAKKTKTSR